MLWPWDLPAVSLSWYIVCASERLARYLTLISPLSHGLSGENILQIFIYNRSSLRSEITTLIVKSLFPVHPIAAAIQSVYVCRRDLEKDPSISLGRIVLPSLVFHGTYDFTLMMITSSWQRSSKEQYFNQSGNVTGVAMASFAASLCIVLAGGLYYRISSRAQYARLQHETGTGSGPLSEASFGLLL